QSWTDPLVLAALSLTLVAAARWRERDGTGGASWVATGVAAGCVAACKQYAPLFLVPLLFAVPARGRWKAAALAICVASATMAPFALWSPRAFYDGVIGFQLTSPFRTDALSWLAAVAYLGGPRLPSWLSIALALATLAAALRPRSTLSQAMTAASAAFLVLLLLGKQAFCNYYWLAGGLLLTVLALDSGGEAARGGSSLEANEEPASDRPGSERSQAAGTLRVFRGSLPAR
ncbi:MAG: hypothetical protein ACJ79R_07525, partial [Anaeromyxobacteraceae bacterium]